MANSVIKQTEANYGGSHSSDTPTRDYVKLPSGILIQWGTLQSVTAQNTLITFLIPFIARPCVVATAGAGSGRAYVCTEDVNTTSFTAWQSDTTSKWIRWVAIGYWK